MTRREREKAQRQRRVWSAANQMTRIIAFEQKLVKYVNTKLGGLKFADQSDARSIGGRRVAERLWDFPGIKKPERRYR